MTTLDPERTPSGSGVETSLQAPSLDLKPIDRLVEIMRLLRSEKGCPWDREQSLESLKPYLIEEAYEVLEAIDRGDRSQLEEELGDLLLQVVFQSQLCSEEGNFTFDDVATHIADKLVRRHPHVFGDKEAANASEVLQHWEAIKHEEKGGGPVSLMEGVPRHLPSLHRAEKMLKRVSRRGFEWENVQQIVDKLDEELAEVKEAMASGNEEDVRSEIGDLLFASVDLSRYLGYHAEELLEGTMARFLRRFEGVEKKVQAQGKITADCELAELDQYWQEVKREE